MAKRKAGAGKRTNGSEADSGAAETEIWRKYVGPKRIAARTKLPRCAVCEERAPVVELQVRVSAVGIYGRSMGWRTVGICEKCLDMAKAAFETKGA